MSSDWIDLGNKHYRKTKLYDMIWEKRFELEYCRIAVSPYGGPIALYRNEDLLILTHGEDLARDNILIFASNGEPLTTIPWKGKTKVVGIDWDDEERLIIVQRDGTVSLFETNGTLRSTKSLGQTFMQDDISEAKIYGKTIIFCTKMLHFYWVPNIDTKPVPYRFAHPVFSEPPCDFALLPSDYASNGPVEIIVPDPNGGIHVINENISSRHFDQSQLEEENSIGVVKKIAISPNNQMIAFYEETGDVVVTDTHFSPNLFIRSATKKKKQVLPKQMVWCGEDCVTLVYQKFLGIVGPGGLLSLPFPHKTDAVFASAEIDGLRIVTMGKCEFLQKVPECIVSIYDIGSFSSGALLKEAYEAFVEGKPNADENIRSIKEELPEAIEQCVEAAGYQNDSEEQKLLLKTASYGKTYIQAAQVDVNLISEKCRQLRVINSLKTVGRGITSAQFEKLGADRIIHRLYKQGNHYLAYEIGNYLNLNTEAIYVDWAITKIREDYVSKEEELAHAITRKVMHAKSVSFTKMAIEAYNQGRNDLALRLLENEKSLTKKVPLLLDMGKFDLALDCSIRSGDTNLSYLVIMEMQKTITEEEFFELISQRAIAKDLFLTYTRQADEPLFKKGLRVLGLKHQGAIEAIRMAYGSRSINMRVDALNIANKLFIENEDGLYSKATEDQLKLLKVQEKLVSNTRNTQKMDKSLSQLIYEAYKEGNAAVAHGLEKEFKVPEKRSWHLKMKAYAESNEWDMVDQMYSEKKNLPIPAESFAQLAIKYGRNERVKNYVGKIPDIEKRLSLLKYVDDWDSAIDVALTAKKQDLLQRLGQETDRSDIRNKIGQALIQLQSKK
eukprot:CAMPEP_0114983650 /NCGR_PEP_ID=MMETSP0216-20121206/6821_1 /TAXON_ID=223996 /ORGANISM="Protocruzia adherens, Strain Boccale" /LENGTH=838 /DNA_ID=CAMNT_0002345663 /DNA_START=131 /DNA_END=2647 /DNA_ORIENTATION=+